MDVTITSAIVDVTVEATSVSVAISDTTTVAITIAGGLHGYPEDSFMVQIAGTVGEEVQYFAPFDFLITDWTMLLDVSGSMAVDVWKDTYANHPPTVADSIITPSVSSAQQNQATGLSIAVTKGDCLIFHVDSATTATLAAVSLNGTRT